MEISTINIIISALVGLISGAIGSLIAPWVHWRIEKRRIQLERRLNLLEKARIAAETWKFGPQFLHSDEYARLRPYSKDKVIQGLESHPPALMRGGDRKNLLLDELARLERAWGIS